MPCGCIKNWKIFQMRHHLTIVDILNTLSESDSEEGVKQMLICLSYKTFPKIIN